MTADKKTALPFAFIRTNGSRQLRLKTVTSCKPRISVGPESYGPAVKVEGGGGEGSRQNPRDL